ncbi:hypothetical protein AOLI_G00195530 [Acnodon oligacanthus]
MEMEDIYANSGFTADNRRNSDSSGHSYEDMRVNEDDIEMRKTIINKSNSGTVNAEKVDKTSLSHTADPQYRGLCTADRRCFMLTVVCLGLLCGVLLAAITVLWVKFTTERDKLLTSYNTLSEAKNHLELSYISVMNERDELQRKLSSAGSG